MNEHARPVNRLVNRHSVDQLADIRARIKGLQAEEKLLVSEVSEMMGDADSLAGSQYIARQTVSTRKGAIDTAQLEAIGIDADQFRKPDVTVFQIRLEEREREAG